MLLMIWGCQDYKKKKETKQTDSSQWRTEDQNYDLILSLSEDGSFCY